jgi:hypothetical protein
MAWHIVRPPQDDVKMRRERAPKQQDQTQVVLEAASRATHSGPGPNVLSRLVRESLVRDYFELEDEEELDTGRPEKPVLK